MTYRSRPDPSDPDPSDLGPSDRDPSDLDLSDRDLSDRDPSDPAPMLWLHRVVAAIAFAVVLTVSPAAALGATGCWHPPVDAPVVDPFRAPDCPWCSGNRGIEYGTDAGVVVRAVTAGTVTYSHVIAGVGYLVVRHADGRRATYANLAERRFARGDTVVAGAVVGTTAGRFHLGLRDGDRYIDPAPFIGHWVRRPRLVPVDGRRASAADPPHLACRPTGTVRGRRQVGLDVDHRAVRIGWQPR